jgi:glucose/arabinose dehydrogenase
MRRISACALTIALVMSVAPVASALPRGTHVQVFKSGLRFPVDLAWVPGTRKMFFTEKNTGRVRVMIGKRLLARPCVNLDVNSSGESGALGIALHPRFKRNHWLYVYFTKRDPLENRVTRFKVSHNRCRRPKSILRGLPASSGYHNGGQLEFVKGKLFVSTGENHNPSLAQNTKSRLGKILRLNSDGSVPNDNPFGRRNPVWSYGHRNPFGLAHRPGTSWLFESENGPNCDDELNRIRRGRNHGWGPGYTCGTRGVGPRPMGPMRRWTPPIVPTDLTWYRGSIKRLNGSLYMGDFSSGRVHRFRLNDRGTRVIRHNIVYNASSGVVDVAKGPRGLFYIVTSSSILRIVKD